MLITENADEQEELYTKETMQQLERKRSLNDESVKSKLNMWDIVETMDLMN